MLQRKQTPRPSILAINITAVIKYGNGSGDGAREQIRPRVKQRRLFRNQKLTDDEHASEHTGK